jgi:hypothetical protein
MSTIEERNLPHSSGEQTLELFHKSRIEILNVIDRARQLDDKLGGYRDDIVNKMDEAYDAVDSSRLNIVIIGGEGQGKSTFINALTGHRHLSPESELDPGTVAPTFIERGEAITPTYSVELSANKGITEKPCKDRAEFESYILQVHNNGNIKRVERGRIRVKNPMLEHGVCFVDIPGLEGLDKKLAAWVMQYIRNQAHAVIAVIAGRSYGATTRLIESQGLDFTTDGARHKLHAIIANWNTTALKNRTDFDDIRQKGLEHTGTGNIKNPPRVFVLHLPSVIEMKEGKSPEVDTPAHRSEVKEFEKWFDDFLKRYACFSLIGNGYQHASAALDGARRSFHKRRNVLTMLLKGDESGCAGLQRSFEEAKQQAAAEWGKVINVENVKYFVEKYWPTIERASHVYRDHMLKCLKLLSNDLESRTERIDDDEVKQFENELAGLLRDARKPLDASYGSALLGTRQYFYDEARKRVRQVYQQVPVLNPTLNEDDDQLLEEDNVTGYAMAEIKVSATEKVLKWLSVGGAATGGAMGAGGAGIYHLGSSALLYNVLAPLGVTPVGAAIAGGAALGIGTLWLINKLRDGNRAAVKQELDNAKRSVGRLDTSEGGGVYEAWERMVNQIAVRVDEELQFALRNLQDIIEIPERSREDLQAELNEVERYLKLTQELKEVLEPIQRAFE